MYKFVFQKDKTDIEIILIQAMLVLAAVAVFVYRQPGYQLLGYIMALLLLLVAVFMKPLLIARGISKWLILAVAAVVLFAATWQVYFAIILLVYGGLIQWLVKAPEVTVGENGVTIKTTLSTKISAWDQFNAVMIKDGILVLDRRNNHIQYLTICEEVKEQEFNAYCAGCITP